MVESEEIHQGLQVLLEARAVVDGEDPTRGLEEHTLERAERSMQHRRSDLGRLLWEDEADKLGGALADERQQVVHLLRRLLHRWEVKAAAELRAE